MGTLIIGNAIIYAPNNWNFLTCIFLLGRNDKYTITEHIKSGEFGEVFKVHDTNRNMQEIYFFTFLKFSSSLLFILFKEKF